MKSLLRLGSFVVLVAGDAFAAPAPPAPPTPPTPIVSQVVVYPDRAQVSRAMSIACGPRAVASFAGLTPAADPSSFRAQTSAGTIEGLRYEERTRAESFAPEVKAVDEQIRTLEGERAALGNARQRDANAARLAGQYTDVAVNLIGREMSEAGPNTKNWGAAFDTVLAARQKAAKQSIEVGAKQRKLDYQLDDLRRKRGRLTVSGERREYLAEVLVSCPAGATTRVELTYLVGGTSWEPAYEARADESASLVELSTYATVRQATGEDWSGVKLILSTAVPRQNATPPEIRPLNVWAEERGKQQKVLVRRDELQEHAEASGNKQEAAKDLGGKGQLRAAEQGLSVQLVVPEPADVAGDNTPVRLFVARTPIKAQFAYRSAPKLMPFVFRVADLVNSAGFPLLPGTLDAFRKGGLIARYPLERTAQGQKFHLTFGIEEGLRVKRTVIEELKRDTGLFGSTRRFRYAYRFDVANYTGHDEQVELSEHIPVSELDDVKVMVDVKTTGGYESRAEDGILTWKLKLKPNEKRAIDLAYHADVPSSYDSGAL